MEQLLDWDGVAHVVGIGVSQNDFQGGHGSIVVEVGSKLVHELEAGHVGDLAIRYTTLGSSGKEIGGRLRKVEVDGNLASELEEVVTELDELIKDGGLRGKLEAGGGGKGSQVGNYQN